MGNKKTNILFLGGSKKISLAKSFIKAGQVLKTRVKIFSYELKPLEPICLVGQTVPGLKWDDERIQKHLVETITRHKINVVIPFVDQATILCGQLQEVCPDTFFPVSSKQACQIMFDKIRADTWFREHKFLVPENIPEPPLIAKPRVGSGGKQNVIIHNGDELAIFKKNYSTEEYLVQRFIDGVEYTVDCYVDRNGRVVSIIPRQRLEVMSGEVTRSLTEKNQKIINLARKIINLAALRGPLAIQFLKEKGTGKIYVTEVNARIGSGVVTSIAAGANIAQFILNDLFNIPNDLVSNWRENLLMTRAFQEVYFYRDHLLD